MPRPPTVHCNRCNGPKRLGKFCYTCRKRWTAVNDPTYHLAYYEKNADVIRARAAQWKRDNKERVAEQHKRRRDRENGVYGTVSAEEFVAQCKRQEQRCYDCGQEKPLTVGHLIPLYAGGTHTAANIVAQCVSCNARQGKRIHRSVKTNG